MKKLNTAKFLESLKSIKLPNSLTSLKSLKLSKFPKSSDSIKFDKTKTAKAVSSVALFGLSGWFLWHTFLAAPEATLPPSLPPTVATMNPAPVTLLPPPVIEPIKTEEDLMVTEQEELIEAVEELLVAVETQEEIDEIPNQVLENTQHASMETLELITEQLEPDASHETTKSYDDEPATETSILASTPESDETPQEAHPYMLTARSNLDARDCLTLTENMDIHRCAENFR